MSTRAAAIEPVTELIDVISDGLDLVSDMLYFLELVFQAVDLVHDSFHLCDLAVCTLHATSGSAARISD